MKKVAIKNRITFFGGTAIVGLVAIFIFSVGFTDAILTAPQAHAYAIGSAPPAGSVSSMPSTPSMPIINSINSTDYNFDFGNSFQNLVSPFTSFIDSLKWNNTTFNASGGTSALPTINLTPTLESGIQNTFSQWLSEFDNWFYGISGVQLSGIFYALLSVTAWALGLAQQVVNWLLGFFH